jgi:hypothetical protein
MNKLCYIWYVISATLNVIKQYTIYKRSDNIGHVKLEIYATGNQGLWGQFGNSFGNQSSDE